MNLMALSISIVFPAFCVANQTSYAKQSLILNGKTQSLILNESLFEFFLLATISLTT